MQPTAVPHVEHGFYRHFKGGLYFVLGVSTSSEGDDHQVVYYSLEYRRWRHRPYASAAELADKQRCGFTDRVSRRGYSGPRFVPVTVDDLSDAEAVLVRDAMARSVVAPLPAV
jgi:hypothetical protein